VYFTPVQPKVMQADVSQLLLCRNRDVAATSLTSNRQ
jgi:hypothetical protein